MLYAADLVLVPIIPTTLSLRTLDQLTEFIGGFDGHRPAVLAFCSMIDRRKRLHKEIAERLPAERTDVATTAIPALSMIEQMAVERAPVTAFAPRSAAARGYAELWGRGARPACPDGPACRPRRAGRENHIRALSPITGLWPLLTEHARRGRSM